jgi:hypothetical protein
MRGRPAKNVAPESEVTTEPEAEREKKSGIDAMQLIRGVAYMEGIDL